MSHALKTLPGTDEAPWQEFDPEAYFQHYYGEPHPDDDTLTYLAARALRAAQTNPGRDLDIIDVGTGPSLIPLLAALPVATRLTAWEYAAPNLRWLHNEITSPPLRPQWQHFWRQVKAAHSSDSDGMSPLLPHDPLPLLTQRVRIVRGSIFDLPRHVYDAATMFFCAESITSCPAEFESALGAFLATVRPGGIIAAAFLAGSSGYAVSGRRYPAVKLDAKQIQNALKSRLATIAITPIGISPEEVRSGYTGAIFVSGKTRA
jgi:hypothetical protein